MTKKDNTVSLIKKDNILDEQTLKKILDLQKQTGQSLITVLKQSDLVNEKQFARIVAAKNNIEFVNLSPDMIDPMVAHMISYELATQHNIVPVKKQDDSLVVAMSSPMDLAARNQVEMRTGYKLIPVAATPNAIRQVIRYHFNVKNVTRQAIASMRLKDDAQKDKGKSDARKRKQIDIENDPVTKLVNSIIIGAIDVGASDIHIQPQNPDMLVRYRIDGLLRNEIEIPASAQQTVISHIKVIADMDISEKRLPQDGHIEISHNAKEYDLRISSMPAIGGEKIVIRILDKSSNQWRLDDVVTDAEDNLKFRQLAKNPYGMILITGPTGSGKTTTLYSMLQLLNKPEKNIVTVEDPVEYRLDGITQIQVKSSIGMSFASALRSIVRQDPDIILIGEIRDIETAEIAISAAQTGHLVLSTLHANDAVTAVSRLINIGISPFLAASALLGTVTQRLIRKLCTKCKDSYEPTRDTISRTLGLSLDNTELKLYKHSGCTDCYDVGYKGRQAIYEIMPVSAKIRKLIVESASEDIIKQQAIKEGMKSLHKSGINEVIKGKTDIAELQRIIDMRMQ